MQAIEHTYRSKIDNSISRLIADLTAEQSLPMPLPEFRERFLTTYSIDQDRLKSTGQWKPFKVRFYEAIKRLEGTWITSSYTLGEKKQPLKIIDQCQIATLKNSQ